MIGIRVCPQCNIENKKKNKLKTNEKYLNELKDKDINIVPLETYIDSETPINHKCLAHNYIWKVRPNQILRGSGCPKCRSEKTRNRSVKSNNVYVNELSNKNPNIIPLETYINSKTKILHKCLICNYEWTVAPGSILLGSGCPKCSGNVGKTPEEYIKCVKENNSNIEILEEYNVSKKNILCKCNKHNIIWKADAANILRGGGCRLCGLENSSLKRLKSNDIFIKELKENNPDVISLENYKGSSKKILFKCLKCGNEWRAIAGDIVKGHGCPKCKKSLGENKIEQWLIDNNIQYEPQKKFSECADIFPLPFDFYIPEYGCIEYDGIQHFEPIDHFGGQENFEYIQRHDQIKNEFCKSNNIPLLRIPYYADVEKELEQFLFN